jgi:hypothetical protein
MWKLALHLLGRRAVHQVLAKQGQNGRMDFRFGLKLWRDRRVPAGAKIQSLLLALLAMLFVNILEIPAEAILAIAVPGLGLGANLLWNGFENILGPILFTGWMLPRIAPRQIVELILREESSPVIDVEHYTPTSPQGQVVSVIQK